MQILAPVVQILPPVAQFQIHVSLHCTMHNSIPKLIEMKNRAWPERQLNVSLRRFRIKERKRLMNSCTHRKIAQIQRSAPLEEVRIVSLLQLCTTLSLLSCGSAARKPTSWSFTLTFARGLYFSQKHHIPCPSLSRQRKCCLGKPPRADHLRL